MKAYKPRRPQFKSAAREVSRPRKIVGTVSQALFTMGLASGAASAAAVWGGIAIAGSLAIVGAVGVVLGVAGMAATHTGRVERQLSGNKVYNIGSHVPH